ncbi:MAG: YceI family protein [Alishewanella sp.]|nr:YceI family protein [Alishewanella sp.]MDP5186653.1 YceI family protein [Alishewanella sp.]
MKKLLLAATLATLSALPVHAADYVIDTQGAHAFVQFKISHLGYSWLYGRFNTFAGDFSYDAADLTASKIQLSIDTNSIDSNHAERDKHLRGSDFLNVAKHPKATFVSTKVVAKAGDNFDLHGKLTLNGVTKDVVIAAEKIGEGQDPWGGYRAGFAGTTSFALKDFGINYDLGPASSTVYMELSVEGIKQ